MGLSHLFIGHTDLVISGAESDLSTSERKLFAMVLFSELRDPSVLFEDGMDEADRSPPSLIQ